MKQFIRVVALMVMVGITQQALALIIPSDQGLWPATWPKELESLRKRSKTLDVATGTQEHIYTIPFEDQEEFEKLWPILLKLRTPGSPVTLSRAGGDDAGWDQFLSNAKPAVRIKGPTGAYAGGNVTLGSQIDLKQLEDGTMLHAAAPWPKELIGPNGELPEYVSAKKLENGKLVWKSIADLAEDERGFHNRARVDLELIIDGEIIDLNRIALPEDARLIDRRFVTPVSAK